MLKRLGNWILAVILISSWAGCVRTVDDRHKWWANPLAKDKIEGRYEAAVDKVFRAAKDTVSLNGQLTGENTIINTVEGIIDTRHVWVRVDSLGDRWSRATVQVRARGGGADIGLASEIDKQIALRLATDKPVPPFVPAVDQNQARPASSSRR
ncbi:MAG: hypothetical protein HYR88_00010 [Verrucomicrobia bacterium]|nr:hypothetical protein [Verrucomicrobiota bacterium]MBI3867481.1 hypothetical protein [Verrucomicrobiota bacterium]